MGRLIVFEGIDGSGKSTQFGLMCKRLEGEGTDFRRLVFPQYSEPSSALIRMYLGGEFGTKPDDVNAYTASAFFAVDRFASFSKVWKDYYNAGGVMLADRYTTSNAVHQGAKLKEHERSEYFGWLYEFEFERMKLPKPDLVVYLDVPVEVSESQMRRREAETNTKGDIHETDREYLVRCRETGLEAAKYYGWSVVNCADGGRMRTIDDIHSEVYRLVTEVL